MPVAKSHWTGHDPSAVHIALINNMPDAVLRETESQFCDLLHAASPDIAVHLELFSLPHIPRGESAQRRIAEHYADFPTLFHRRFDAAIVTGTEPRHFDLRQEPYWTALVDVLNWAAECTTSTILSCLAAHAGVLHQDGIAREPLPTKQFGVFPFQRNQNHWLVRDASRVFRIPHSRWNALPPDALTSCGYQILTASPEAGVDLFIKPQKNSMFVYFQGHPEYQKSTLLEEYRRDVRRFLKGSRDAYPPPPQGCFDTAATQIAEKFRESVIFDRTDQRMADFPEASLQLHLEHAWLPAATRLYRNWLEYIASQKSALQTHPALLAVDHA